MQVHYKSWMNIQTNELHDITIYDIKFTISVLVIKDKND
jgi:hypothetical protein